MVSIFVSASISTLMVLFITGLRARWSVRVHFRRWSLIARSRDVQPAPPTPPKGRD